MGSLMCVDIDMNLDAEEDEANGVATNNEVSRDKPGVVEILESEVREAKEKGDGGTLRWLELEGLDIDDDMLLSLGLSTRFPVCTNTSFCFYFSD